jgi:hypothetical protein
MKLLRNSGLSTLSLIICLCLPCFGADYNYGFQLFYSPPSYSTHALIYSLVDPKDSTTAGNTEYLASNYTATDGHIYGNNSFNFLRTIKLIDLSSVYITVYDQDYRTREELFVLNDLLTGRKIILNNMQMEEFNRLICNRGNSTLSDKSILILYIILSNIDKPIFIVEDISDIDMAYNIPVLGASNKSIAFDSTKSFANQYSDSIQNYIVAKGDTTIVSQCVYNLDKGDVINYSAKLYRHQLVAIENRIVISKEIIDRYSEYIYK